MIRDYLNIGKSIPRVDVKEKVTGQSIYTADLHLPGQLYGIGVYADVPYGEILNIETISAWKTPGIKAILTAQMVPGRNYFGSSSLEQPVICNSEVRFTGDAVALVAADSLAEAEKAASRIHVRYRQLQGVYSIEDALISKNNENNHIINHLHREVGDIANGFDDSYKVVEGTFRTPSVEHLYLEIECALATYEPDGKIVIYGASQEPQNIPPMVAPVLGLPKEHVRFVSMTVGGAFGGKAETSSMVACRAALLAWHCHRPVLFSVSRADSIRSSTKRHASYMRYRLGADRKGKLTAVEAQVYLDKGAYLTTGGINPPALNRAFWHATGPYNIPHVKLDCYLVRTNNPCGGQFRSPGVPQVAFAVESLMDQLSKAISIDPLEFRLINALEAGMTTAHGEVLKESVGYKKTLFEAAKVYGWPSPPQKGSKEGIKRGVGLAGFWHGISVNTDQDMAEAHIYLLDNGDFLVRTGLVELGQGLKTVLAQVTAAALGISMKRVTLADPDTDSDPDSKKTTSSRATVVGSRAIILAAENTKRKLFEYVAKIYGQDLENLEWVNGLIKTQNTGWSINLKCLIEMIGAEGPLLVGSGRWQRETGEKGYEVYGYASHIAEVEVDKNTGKVRVVRLVLAQDVGRALNPVGVEGQMAGSAAMGIGSALWEEIKIAGGQIINPSIHDYHPPTALDMPEMECLIVEDPISSWPFGAKGVGEPGVPPLTAAIANAIYDAVGIRVYDLPLNMEKIFEAIQKDSDDL